jgi:methyltransferase
MVEMRLTLVAENIVRWIAGSTMFPLAWVLMLTICSRVIELAISALNSRQLRARGWREVGAGHYPLFVVLHLSLLAAVALTTPVNRRPIWALICILGVLQVLRFWTILSLGRAWTTRIITCDTAPLSTSGPYRFIRHPAYAIVSIEVLTLPMAFRNWPVALVWSALNILLLRHRIATEDAIISVRRLR